MAIVFHGRPALLVVDMQNCMLHPSGSFSKMGLDVSLCREVVDPINQIVDAFQVQKLPVIFFRECWNEDYSDAALTLEKFGPIKEMKGMIRGTWDAEIVDELKRDHVEIIDKTQPTGFYKTNLEKRLRELNVTDVVITGVGFVLFWRRRRARD